MQRDGRETIGFERDRGGTSDASPLARHLAAAEPPVLVPVVSLHAADSPRLAGESVEHVRAIAESDTEPPPILVHRATMRVVDGMHRLRAAIVRGQDHVLVQYVDGDAEEVFLIAVEANAEHGLPLTPADRRAAATRIIGAHPHRSDRWIAQLSGLSARTVSALRRCSTATDARSNERLGRDGRTRPLSSADGRRLAGELMRGHPERSLRDIAREAGIAPSTALDVRNRIAAGLDPVLDGRPRTPGGRAPRRSPASRPPEIDPVSILRNLHKDPSLRFTEGGRALLRWLDTHTVNPDTVREIPDVVPTHCIGTVVALARYNAHFWSSFGAVLDDVAKDSDAALESTDPGA